MMSKSRRRTGRMRGLALETGEKRGRKRPNRFLMTTNHRDTSCPPAYDSSQHDEGADYMPRDKGAKGGPVAVEARYVYYRVYAPDGAIPSKTALNSGNPFIGRIKATSVPPPLNVASLKRTLAQTEGLPDSIGSRTTLYRFPSDQTPMDEAEKVSILGIGIASTPTAALALVFVEELSNTEKNDLPAVDNINYVPQYVYYRLHTRSGEEHSAQAFDPNEPAIGRMDQMAITPPANVLALKRCIAKMEGKPIYAFGDLYSDMNDESPQTNEARITVGVVGADFRGCRAADALRVVQPERRSGLHNRPLKILAAQSLTVASFWRGLFWLDAPAGEIFNTDGIIQTRTHRGRGARCDCYTAVDAKGFEGLILAENTKFLDE
ncbi:hypothetical protein B0H10DRAFT_2009268 [Mycena sp. CBHHK59/15]|nr:hypothetical protein B0H10DRAFT_2009268 [Mycena sp. CBHHK59/15]